MKAGGAKTFHLVGEAKTQEHGRNPGRRAKRGSPPEAEAVYIHYIQFLTAESNDQNSKMSDNSPPDS